MNEWLEFFIEDQRIVGVLKNPASDICVVTCHGLFYSKESEKYVEISKEFSKNNIAVLRFDFRGCGESSGRFEKSTLSQRLEDLEKVLEYVFENFNSVGILGSSFGGVVSLIEASKNPKIGCVVTWSSPFHLVSLFKSHSVEGEFLEDLKRYNMVEVSKNVRNLLVIHGSRDELVPLQHAKDLYKNASNPKKLKILEDNHRITEKREEAIKNSLEWFKIHLGG
ncbi:MAG: alpha/beta hydrolase family protein [Candidatus Methanofastidiosia archaeon]